MLVLGFESHRGEVLNVLAKKRKRRKDQLLRALHMAWVEAHFDASHRGSKCAEVFTRQNARHVLGRVEESLVCDPGSELQLGGREKRRAKIIYGMG